MRVTYLCTFDLLTCYYIETLNRISSVDCRMVQTNHQCCRLLNGSTSVACTWFVNGSIAEWNRTSAAVFAFLLVSLSWAVHMEGVVFARFLLAYIVRKLAVAFRLSNRCDNLTVQAWINDRFDHYGRWQNQDTYPCPGESYIRRYGTVTTTVYCSLMPVNCSRWVLPADLRISTGVASNGLANMYTFIL